MVPADILVLKSSASNGFCYLQTSSLDGETGLKPREAIVRFQSFIKSEADLIKIKGDILVDAPNENINSINGSITLDTNEKIYFSIINTLLRVILF
jgi:magnesium-transporting ATPase (P-type)